jgi:methylthioribose-1-phosphate isomerase
MVYKNADYLNSSRPTAVNLSWALNRLVQIAKNFPKDSTAKELYSTLRAEAISIHDIQVRQDPFFKGRGLRVGS